MAGFDGWWMAGGWREGIGSLRINCRGFMVTFAGVDRSPPQDFAKRGFAGEDDPPPQDILSTK